MFTYLFEYTNTRLITFYIYLPCRYSKRTTPTSFTYAQRHFMISMRHVLTQYNQDQFTTEGVCVCVCVCVREVHVRRNMRRIESVFCSIRFVHSTSSREGGHWNTDITQLITHTSQRYRAHYTNEGHRGKFQKSRGGLRVIVAGPN